jgi:sugar O-acyltransferase (sialic acid O-acetyltransferase NeuD family)
LVKTGEKMKKLLVLGTRTLAVEIADLASDTPGYEVVGFVENMDPNRCKDRLAGLPVLWVEELADRVHDHWAVCGLATTRRSRFVHQVAAIGMGFERVIHPSARVSSNSTVGAGSILSVGVIVATHTRLGEYVLVNRGSLIGHHTRIEAYATVQPGANIAGECRIGEGAFVGMGAIVLERVTVGAGSVVGAGAVVTKDVPDHVQVVGVPARIVKEGVDGK